MKKKISIICVILLCLILTGCGSSQLVGRWIEKDGSEVLVFEKSGTGSADGFRFDWYTSGNRLFIVFFDQEEYAYSISGNSLSLQKVYSDGSLSREVDVYNRQGGSTTPIGVIALIVIILISMVSFFIFKKSSKPSNITSTDVESTNLSTETKDADEGITKVPEAEVKKIDICPKCSAELPKEAFFCPGCGLKVDDLRSMGKGDREIYVLHDKPEENKPTPMKRKLTDGEGKPSEEDSINNLIRVWFECPSCGARFERHGTKDNPPEFGYCYRCHYDGKSPLAGNETRIKISKNFHQQKADTGFETPDPNAAFAPERIKYTTHENKRTVDSITENTTIEPSPGMKICPNCKTEVRRGAAVCKRCGYEF